MNTVNRTHKATATPVFSILSLITALLFSHTTVPAIDVQHFDTPEQEALYRQLTKELRCMVCQNQNIADSDADLAKDLRQEVAKFIRQGKNKDEITEFLVHRYGDFVRYSPPVRIDTIVLWTLPFIVLLASAFALARKIRYANKNTTNNS